MLPQYHNYGTFLRGATVPEKKFTFTQVIDGVASVIDLSTAAIRCEFSIDATRKYTFTESNGIDATNAAQGEFTIEKFIPEWAGVYKYDIEITFADGTVRTYVDGILDIKNDTTR